MTELAGTMSDFDSLLWAIGADPVLQTPIVAVAVLDRASNWARLTRRVGELVDTTPRLRCRPAPLPLGVWRPRWVEVDDFSLEARLRRIDAPRDMSLRSVLNLAQHMAEEPFDQTQPLWEAALVGPLEEGRSALVLKLHHCLADGIGGLALWSQIFDPHRALRARAMDEGAAARESAHAATNMPEEDVTWRSRDWTARHSRGHRGALGRAVRAIAATAATGATVGANTFASGAAVLRNPIGTAASTARSARAAVELLAPATGPCSELMVGRSTNRHFEVIDLPVGALRLAASRARMTVNDLFLASVSTGLRRYHDLHSSTLNDLRVMMPVSVRSGSDPAAGNRFVPVRFLLDPSGAAGELLERVHLVASQQKHSPALALSGALALVLDVLPARAAASLWGSMLKGDDVCATSVPGPPAATYVAGARLERLYAFAPPSGAALNVSLVTIESQECIGVNIDTRAICDCSKLTACLEEGFGEILSVPTEGVGR